MSSLHPCCRNVSVQPEDIFADWEYFSERLLDQIMHDIFEHVEEPTFDLEYVHLVARRLVANELSHFSAPDMRWIRRFSRNYLVRVSYNKFKTPRSVFGSH